MEEKKKGGKRAAPGRRVRGWLLAALVLASGAFWNGGSTPRRGRASPSVRKP